VAGRYLFYSHDGYGLGHVRRNSLIARAVLDADPGATVSVVTGLTARPRWLEASERVCVHRVPALLKAADGSYRHETLPFEDAVRERERIFSALVRDERPDVVVVDRHPYGTAGELRAGLDVARDQGASVVLGLRDVLDEPAVVRRELQGLGWAGVEDVYDDVLVYGGRHFLDHAAEYGQELPLRYCGWVVERPLPARVDPDLLVVAAGGGGDGAGVFELGAQLLALVPAMTGLFAPGPYAGPDALRRLGELVAGRARIVGPSEACSTWFPRAAAVVCMAGYNSTLEALAAGAPGAVPVIDAGRREVFVLDGSAPVARRPQELELEPGTQPGTVVVLHGKGMPVLRSRDIGDLYIQVVVETPQNLTRRQRELLMEFERASSDETHPESSGFFSRVREFFDGLSGSSRV
jgi:predicted glycosyltransferase